jgi:protein O-GlcNAc transferase
MVIVALMALMLGATAQSALDSGQQALQAGDLARAEQLFRQYLAQNPNSAEALSNMGALSARRGQFAEAVTYYEKALKANPKLIPVHFNMAVALGQMKEYPKAAAHLREFLKSYPNEPRAHQLLGLCLTETGDLKTALAELEASYELNPKDLSILYALSYAHARAGDDKRAEELAGQATSNPAQAKLIEGLIEYRRDRYAEAKALFAEVLKLDPNSVPALAASGRVSLAEHNDPEAIRMLERVLQLNPADAESTYQLGVLYDRNGRSEEGVSLLRRAITLRANIPTRTTRSAASPWSTRTTRQR